MTITEIKAEEVTEGDTFVRDGQPYWTARSDAEIVTNRSKESLVRVLVQFVDGGIEDRYWDPETILTVLR